MKQGIETGPINKETVVQVIGSVPSRTLARPEVHVSLLIQDWRVRGLGVYRDSIIETTDVDTELNPVAWNPRKDVVEYLVDLEKDVLSSQGATSMTDFLLTNYVGNMKKLAAISGTFSGMLKQNLQEELPRSLGAFMKGYLDQRGQTQTDCAMETGVSQALISNAVKGRPISIGLIKILKGLDVEDEIKEVAFGLYAQPTVKDEVDVTGILHRSRWVQDLYSLDKETLERSGFEGSEDYFYPEKGECNMKGREIGRTERTLLAAKRKFGVEIVYNPVPEFFEQYGEGMFKENATPSIEEAQITINATART